MKILGIQPVAMAVGLALVLVVVAPVTGCRSGEGAECLTDSDCKMGLVCVKRSLPIDGERYEEHWGTCFRDMDGDSIPDDGDLSDSSVDRRCGVHVIFHQESGTEMVLERIIDNCDDNCPEVANSRIARRFVCLARDDCCEASEDRKKKADKFDLCSDITDVQDSCTVCFEGENPTPETCYLAAAGGLGYDVDSRGCVHCRPLQLRVFCMVPLGLPDSCVDSLANGELPTPACSGEWQCSEPSGGFCKFVPDLELVVDKSGYTVLFQLDADWDGVGDECDNCPMMPNGIECENPRFELNCDADQNGLISSDEIATGDQANWDGDAHGDACDLCFDLSDVDNLPDDDNGDLDNDGDGNPCDCDDDGDHLCDPGITQADCLGDDYCTGTDNCPKISNPDQRDLNGDGEGDLCDTDPDGDGVRSDGDGSGVVGDNPCSSGQGHDCDDNCPMVPNSDQRDSDGNGIGDACEP